MVTQDPLGRIGWLFHFTDIGNLPSIKATDGLYSTAMLRAKGIKGFRPGGNELSLELDQRTGMDKYVHLASGSTTQWRMLLKMKAAFKERFICRWILP